jgi:hypothetical protein
MKKRFAIWTLALVACAGLAVFLWRWQQMQHMPTRDQGISQKDLEETVRRIRGDSALPAPTPIKPIPLKQPVRLAIGGLGRDNDEQNRQLEDLVLADLTGAPGLELVERQSLDKVLQELNLGISHLVRAQDAVRVGKLLKADWFLLGTPANINGTNTLVVRLVDSRTGIMREAGVFPTDGSQVQLAADLAGFVRQSRQDAVTAKPRVYLAIGTFRDLSLNNRQAAFPTQLRAYLNAAYQGANVTLLEREAVDVLYREVQLDLKGLTEGGTVNPAQPLQAAYWFVDGEYQSYETTNLQVEVSFWVNRIFGRGLRGTLRGPPDHRLFAMIKEAIDSKMRQDDSPVLLSFANEADTRMDAGKELAGLNLGGFINNAKGMYWGALIRPTEYQKLDEQEIARHRRNAEEAIRAFETVLLLEPTNREAKLCLAACFRNQTIARVDEARNLYREIIEEPIPDQWAVVAQKALLATFDWWSDPSDKARWFAAAIQHDTNPAINEFYRTNSETAARDASAGKGSIITPDLAEKRLLEHIRSSKIFMDGKGGTFYERFGLREFRMAFGDGTAAARAMADLLPKMALAIPELAPHITAEVLWYQVETNPPVVAEYQRQLEWCMTHTNQIFHPEKFWELARNDAVYWLFSDQQYDLASKTLEGYCAVIAQKITDDDKIALGFAYMGAERWKEALEVFDRFGGKTVHMTTYGPWGNVFDPVFPGIQANRCRQKLGLPAKLGPREFALNWTRVYSSTPSAFAAGDDGVWIAIGNQLLHLNLDLKTNLAVQLPENAFAPSTVLAVGASKMWIGTAGDGLIEYDKTTHQCRRMTVNDGLLMDYVASLETTDDSLWIGYGGPAGGGLGRMDLLSGKLSSFMPSMNTAAVISTGEPPPREAVGKIVAGADGDLWLYVANDVRQFHVKRNMWESLPRQTTGDIYCFCADSKFLVEGVRPRGALAIQNLQDHSWQVLEDDDGIPNPPSAVTLDGDNVWVGGEGVLTLVDLKKNEVKRICHINAAKVDCIQIAGGYIWVQCEGYLYRASLSSLQ